MHLKIQDAEDAWAHVTGTKLCGFVFFPAQWEMVLVCNDLLDKIRRATG